MTVDDRFIKVNFANKKDMLPKLQKILHMPRFCGEKLIDLRAIIRLWNDLKDDIFYIFEYPYVDRHYRDTFYFYHSTKFEELYRDCIRVHLFSGFSTNTINDLIIMSDDDKEKYRGFFIVRPLSRFPLGRSLISPSAFKKRNIVCCLMKSRISLLGQRLEAFGFPHIAQDNETHSCAESSLWSLFEYLGNRYIQYLPLLPSQIIHKLSSVSNHRSLPSIGLSMAEISSCLHDNGCECVIDKAMSINNKGAIVIDKFRLFFLKIYIESGVPVYVTVADNKGPGHAVLIIGHEDEYSHITLASIGAETWKDVSSFKKNMVIIDDNLPPYQTRTLENLISYNKDYKINNYFVPLPKHTNLDARAAFFLTARVFDDKDVGLKRFGKKWLTRLFLTGSHSFKNFLLKHCGLNEYSKKYLLFLSFPKFIWVSEIYRAEDFRENQKICSGLLIIDATGYNSIESILWYNVGDQLILHNGIGWTDIKPIAPFEMVAYQHNLKGEWSTWKLH
jgi:hypothetical protein